MHKAVENNMFRSLLPILLLISFAYPQAAQSAKPSSHCIYKSVQLNGTKTRDSRQIACVLDNNKGRIFAEYFQALKRNPDVSGEVEIAFRIDANGSVQDAKIVSSTLNDAEFENKLLQKFKGIQWPAMPGVSWSGSHPFTFMTTNKKP